MTPPTPHLQASVPPPPPVLGGGAHSLAREGLGKSQFRGGDIHCGTLYIYLLCAKGNSTDPGITFFKAFGIHVLLKPRLEAKCSAVPDRLPNARAPMFAVSMRSHANY